MNRIIQGDCLEVMKTLPDNSVDSFVSDPPAGIAFMGKKWDTDKGGRKQWCAYMEERFAEALRLCKPGAYGLVWALPRTSHWTATALEDAGWEVKDCIVHLFGSGFPKSMNIGKAIDKMKGCNREVVGTQKLGGTAVTMSGGNYGGGGNCSSPKSEINITAPASPEAKQWDGFGTSLKPSSEHWILVRKPIEGTIAANVLEHGTGGLNIDGCRVETSDKLGGGAEKPTTSSRFAIAGFDRPWIHDQEMLDASAERIRANVAKSEALGRFPANTVLSHSHDCDDAGCADGCPVKTLDGQWGHSVTGKRSEKSRTADVAGTQWGNSNHKSVEYTDSGGASRYFPNFHYYPKASQKDRTCGGKAENNHPTVKNRELMKWLCRLVTPPGGTVLDCFAGSGSTAIACLEEGFNYILIEQDAESVKTANDRVAAWKTEHQPEPTLEQRVEWLETKVSTIDHRSKKTAAIVGQLSLFEVAS
jgi:site-specific DNA-methyltransferase (adenine-specific)